MRDSFCGVLRLTIGRLAAVLVLSVLMPLLGGCEGPTKLPVTPNVLQDGSGSRMLAQLPAAQQHVDLSVLYATDRAAHTEPGGVTTYGLKRSPSLSFGVATVTLKPKPTWDELVSAAGTATGDKRYELAVQKIEEKGRILVSATSFEMGDGELRPLPEAEKAAAVEIEKFTELVRTRLAASSRKDVYLYVHGVDNTFEDSVSRAAIIWHYTGREGVMLAYTWPAGRGGALGYFYDRESGEYTVLHLKRLISRLAQMPEVERIHLIAHSRGCDVSTTALRELNIECRARGQRTQKELKLETLVLASADLDTEVFSLRVTIEDMAVIARRFVVYSSAKDELVGFADWLFHSRMRLGTLSQSEVPAEAQKLLAQVPNMEFVQCYVSGYGTTHDFVFTNPGALSDLVLVLRERRDPGVANGRPLTPLGGAFWKLDNDYALPTTRPTTLPATRPAKP